ncbi:hypothetical protein HPB50_005988 [Hyalomma asiaticum]|uniref:Uncharacterized protein n=1 Tax=Hyalomma asiaticum TaxID=266040 RepID=A0ACB7S3W5_HYAAI|nr:hypothetical protein HPB50_005988 [Hyalomma asiaticum]
MRAAAGGCGRPGADGDLRSLALERKSLGLLPVGSWQNVAIMAPGVVGCVGARMRPGRTPEAQSTAAWLHAVAGGGAGLWSSSERSSAESPSLDYGRPSSSEGSPADTSRTRPECSR